MKNVFLTALLVLICAVGANAQKVVTFTKSVGDTLWVQESQIVRITKTTAGSNLEYFNEHGDYVAEAVRERSADTANVASSVAITFSGSAGAIDSIVINGVEILTDTVGFTTNIATTVGLVEDSIDNNTQSPVNYAAAVSDSTLTISAPAAFGDTANGYVVTVYVRGGVTVTTANPTAMAGGFTVVRNILTLTDRVFNVESGANAYNADRVTNIKKAGTDDSVLYIEGAKKGSFTTTDSPAVVTAAINAL